MGRDRDGGYRLLMTLLALCWQAEEEPPLPDSGMVRSVQSELE